MKTKGIFITGATGQIGKELLRHLLIHEPAACFYVLIRAGRKLSASDRFRQLVGELSGMSPAPIGNWQDRIFPVNGNLELPIPDTPCTSSISIRPRPPACCVRRISPSRISGTTFRRSAGMRWSRILGSDRSTWMLPEKCKGYENKPR